MIKFRYLASFVCAGILLSACSNGSPTALPEPESTATSGSATSSTPATATAVSSTSKTDALVCSGDDGLEHRGKDFYPTYKEILLTDEASVKPVTLSAQLTTIAATVNETDGSETINEASPDLP